MKTLPVRWEQVILRCLEREPARRFAAVQDVARALTDPAFDLRSRGRRQARVVVGLLLLLFVVGAVGGWRWHRRNLSAGARAAAPRSLAVLGLHNLSERADTAWLGTALAELLAAEVTSESDVRRVPAESVTRLRREQALPDMGVLPPELLGRIGATLDADLVLSGSYLDVGDGKLRVVLTLQETRSGATLASETETGDERALPELVGRIGQRLRRPLGLARLSPADVELARATLPAESHRGAPVRGGPRASCVASICSVRASRSRRRRR